MKLTIAVVQMHIEPNDPLRNLLRIEEFVARASARGADLVVFPEDCVCGPLRGQTAFVMHAPAYLLRMQTLAAKYAVDLVPGTWTVAEHGLLYNQAHYISRDGSLAGVYRKVNLWETEKSAITPGLGPVVFPTRFGNVGMLICWDISFPLLFTSMTAQGVEMVISPTYWSFPEGTATDTDATKDEIHLIDSLCTTRAFENNVLFVYCNAAGVLEQPGGNSVLSGRSQITHPNDKVLAHCSGNQEEMLVERVTLPTRTPLAQP